MGPQPSVGIWAFWNCRPYPHHRQQLTPCAHRQDSCRGSNCRGHFSEDFTARHRWPTSQMTSTTAPRAVASLIVGMIVGGTQHRRLRTLEHGALSLSYVYLCNLRCNLWGL